MSEINNEKVLDFFHEIGKTNPELSNELYRRWEVYKFINQTPKTKAKDYEILSFIFKGLTYLLTLGKYYNELGGYFEIAPNECEIKIVKRLSDGEVFSIGDKCTDGILTRFKPSKNYLFCWFGNNDNIDLVHHRFISEIQKAKQPLFTEDGVQIFNFSSKAFIVFTKDGFGYEPFNFIKDKWTVDTTANYFEFVKYFSTEAAAKEYILLNKPCLSAKEIFSLTAKYGYVMCDLEKEIKQLAQSKISNL